MEEAKKPGPKETRLRIDPEKFAAAMDRLATDEKLQEKLDNQPIEALEELGIEIDKETREELKGKNLAEIMGVPKEEAAAMRLTPAVVLEPVSIQPKSRVISLTGTLTFTRTRVHVNAFERPPLVMALERPPLVMAKAQTGAAAMGKTSIQTSIVVPREEEAKAEKKKEKKSK
jgi:hypothetical protein